MPENSPMMQQYREMKAKEPDSILFFRLGDFYEMFCEDARLVSEELGLTLTSRGRSVENPDERVPMCGVPFHSYEGYLARLISKGYNVAICEQLEDPATAKGLVKRGIVRVVTPGTVTSDSMLSGDRCSYICCIYDDGESAGLCFADITTGETVATSFSGNDRITHIENELGRFQPREALLSRGATASSELVRFLSTRMSCTFREGRAERFLFDSASELCHQYFGETELDPVVTITVGALLSYLRDTQKCDLMQINRLTLYNDRQYMELDFMTRRNLELTETMRTKELRGSLLWVLDKTKTAMGARLLRSWVTRPMLNPVAILRRQSAVAELVDDPLLRGDIIDALRGMSDMERLISRISTESCNARDLVSLSAACTHLPPIASLLKNVKSFELCEIANMDTLELVHGRIAWMICDEPPFSLRDGGIIRDGSDEDVDRYRSALFNSKALVADLEARERERTGIKKLKVGYNHVFGYYIELPRSESSKVPDEYLCKQTLSGTGRYITQELKELEDTLSDAQNKLTALEYQLFQKLREDILKSLHKVQQTARLIAQLDALCSLAQAAADNSYCRPSIDTSGVIRIKDGRHPVVERTVDSGLFVPNDTLLDNGENRVSIITGPNMAGKSTYMRQTALIVLMAQIGSYVPAASADIGVADRIFTRIGASDDLSAGQSTFMLEMTEVADILKNATRNSLIILDEIGRGTSTYDGMAIARAVLEYCAESRRLGAKTLFATHYHELTSMDKEIDGIKNYSVSVKKRGDEIIFLRKIIPVPADKSYGIEVAKLAGVPQSVINRAKHILEDLENSHAAPVPEVEEPVESTGSQLSIEDLSAIALAGVIRITDTDTMTPIEALNLIYEWKRLL